MRPLLLLLLAGIFPALTAAPIPVIADGKSCFALTAAPPAAEAVRQLQQLCRTAYGTELPAAKRAPELPRFTLGIDAALSDKDFRISAGARGITISGGSEAALKRGVYHFLALAGHETLTLPEPLELERRFAENRRNNAALLPPYRGRGIAKLENSDRRGRLKSPDWLKSLVIVEVRPDTISLAGGLKKPAAMLDFYAAMGVNALWLPPVYLRGPGGNGYGNQGLHLLEPALTGTADQTEARRVLRDFVREAHRRRIYVLLDIITWGTMKESQLQKDHPGWFRGEAWGNAAFNWENRELQKWFLKEAAKLLLDSDADGLRCDCEPGIAGEKIYRELRQKINAAGKAAVFIAEDGTMREAFDLEQDGVLDYRRMDRGDCFRNPVNFFGDGLLDIVDTCRTGRGLGPAGLQKEEDKSGRFRFYANCISNHDFQTRNICGDRLKINYAAIFAPFIPIWYCGDEFGHTAPRMVIYDQHIDFAIADKPENAFFLEDVKAALAIRRRYPEIFEYFPLNHRETNIRRVRLKNASDLPAYSRFTAGKEIVILPNAAEDACCSVTFFSGLAAPAQAVDLRTDRKLQPAADHSYTLVIPPREAAAVLITGR